MLDSKENKVKIEGVLSEIDIKDITYKKGGIDVEAVGGTITIRVNQKANGENMDMDIPVHMFANKLTTKGQNNPAYESISRIKDEYVSIAASDFDHADRVRITGASIDMNEYYSRTGKLVSFPRIKASFVNKIRKEDCKDEATFSAIFVVGRKGYETDADGVENPNRYKISAILPQYGGKVDVVPFVACSKSVIDAVSNYWNEKDTVKANGRLNFIARSTVKQVEVDFGEAKEEVHTEYVSELVITGGSSTPLDGEFAYNENEINEGLAQRNARLEQEKSRAASKPAPTEKKSFDLGF